MKPQKLKRGDKVAILSPSWGGPSMFPKIYEKGLENLRELGLQIKEYPTARADAKYLYENPKARAEDVNNAFADNEVKGIISTIGGDDSIRILPYLDKETIKNNPKFLLGYSDTTILTTFCNRLGLVTFNGPSIMAGFSQIKAEKESFKKHLEDFLLKDFTEYKYNPYEYYFNNYPDWKDPLSVGKVSNPIKNTGWRWLQGSGVVNGELFGGCIEVLEFLKGTDFWFNTDFWNNKILFFETSEEKPSISQVKHMLRNYGMQGVFNKINAVLFGRARDYSDEEKQQLDEIIMSVVSNEFGKSDLLIVSNMDFGHTDPQFILPLGIKAELSFNDKYFKLLESAFN